MAGGVMSVGSPYRLYGGSSKSATDQNAESYQKPSCISRVHRARVQVGAFEIVPIRRAPMAASPGTISSLEASYSILKLKLHEPAVHGRLDLCTRALGDTFSQYCTLLD
jgi:hypothetical protein